MVSNSTSLFVNDSIEVIRLARHPVPMLLMIVAKKQFVSFFSNNLTPSFHLQEIIVSIISASSRSFYLFLSTYAIGFSNILAFVNFVNIRLLFYFGKGTIISLSLSPFLPQVSIVSIPFIVVSSQ